MRRAFPTKATRRPCHPRSPNQPPKGSYGSVKSGIGSDYDGKPLQIDFPGSPIVKQVSGLCKSVCSQDSKVRDGLLTETAVLAHKKCPANPAQGPFQKAGDKLTSCTCLTPASLPSSRVILSQRGCGGRKMRGVAPNGRGAGGTTHRRLDSKTNVRVLPSLAQACYHSCPRFT